MTATKPREFWINESRCTGKKRAHKTELECWDEMQPNDEQIHVIEISALKVKDEKIKDLNFELNCAYDDKYLTVNFLKSAKEENARLRELLSEAQAMFEVVFPQVCTIIAVEDWDQQVCKALSGGEV